MTTDTISFRGGPVFDGARLLDGHCITLTNGILTQLTPERDAVLTGSVVDLDGDMICPGLVDLQVNGGGGVLFNDDPSPQTLARIANAHHSLGTTAFLATLISDTAEKTRAAVHAVEDALAQGVPGLAGLHLEGPHLSYERKGAHDADLIRPMEAADLELLLHAARTLPALMLTVAPENVPVESVSALVDAGAIVSIGHSDADYETCLQYLAAGASCVTHLFNAMSQLGNRAPGVVGAALEQGGFSAGLIADGIHVHPATLRAAWHAKQGPGGLFLVSDAMACAGSDIRQFELGGRMIQREGNRLTLADGTLAGADLTLPRAIATLVEDVGVGTESALAAATRVPARLMSFPDGIGTLVPGTTPSLIRLGPTFDCKDVIEPLVPVS